MSEIYKGRGTGLDREEFIDFLNYVFGFNGSKDDFEELLPKLYKEQYDPCGNNYVVTEDGKPKAAIGVFARTMDVMGEALSIHGIGNVAVHPRERSKGYMRELLSTAIDDMIKSGADMSDLGGLRHRYGYFSYENCSPVYRFDIDRTCMRHIFGDSLRRELTFRLVCENDDPLLDKIAELHAKQSCRMLRPRESFLDIAHSWCERLYAILDGDRFLGYFIGNLKELSLIDIEDFDDVIRAYIADHGSVTLKLPLWEVEMIAKAERLCDGFAFGNDQSFTIFNWKHVVLAFMRLKAAHGSLCDGVLSVKINGVAGVEAFELSVKGGVPSLSEIAHEEAELSLEHREAVAFFFSIISARRMLSPIACAWFPLPLFIQSADHV